MEDGSGDGDGDGDGVVGEWDCRLEQKGATRKEGLELCDERS